MNRPVVLISLESPHSFWRLSSEHERALSAAFPGVEFRRATEEAVPHQLADAHVYFGWRFAPSWLFAAPHLKWIASPAAGTDHLPVAEAHSVGVALTRSYGFHGRPMAEHAMGLVLGFSRGLFTSQRVQRNRALNVIGVRRTPPAASESGITWVHTTAVHQAVSVADVVVNLLPATPDTHRYFDHDLFSACKPRSLFLNLGRAATVDQSALLASLDTGHLRGAALDVFDPKPLRARHPLRLHPRVVLTPKSSVFCRAYMDEAVAFFADNLHRYLSGQPLNGLAEAPATRSPLVGG
ncbi:D-2-hydroxyacid dehydrogenase [Streptomyces sp. CSDS2]|uniref:D-2-hydroxyacid dehydrogenase n=1 Tax=Streptomyces sp. CSDS2 TaxID=3055051 RepID=UPI0025B2227E|nr:D-2-hydroxyacid dehydrogenase [Streptomyces sp. CSDS2]MDN3264140.1 D-2-hydroxyacid dehydrogenase [Streptomyces sp. CSDS2]